MATAPRPLVAGNWKMNGLSASAGELEAIIAGAAGIAAKADLMVCPPATLLARFAAIARGAPVLIGAQDCHAEPAGAFTCVISAEIIADCGGQAVIVGHSERRFYHQEDDPAVKAKAMAAIRAGLIAILCIGETKQERDAGATLVRLEKQLQGSLPERLDAASLVIAYEPVWAIGTGVTPGPADVEEVHAFIRQFLTARDPSGGPGIRILYGGSVKPSNARDLLAVRNVNGALVGGASLKATDFLGIAAAYA